MTVQRILFRRGTTAAWNSANPILSFGEPAIEIKTSGEILLKVGNGSSSWSSLPYVGGADIEEALSSYSTTQEMNSAITLAGISLIGGAPEELNTLGKIATALGGKASTSHTHVKSDITDFSHSHEISDVTGLQTELTSLSNEVSSKANKTQVVETKTGNYEIVANDADKIVVLSSSTQRDFTIANVLAVGQRIDFLQTSTGQINFIAGSGATLVSKDGNKKTSAQYSGATIICISSGTYQIIGDLSA